MHILDFRTKNGNLNFFKDYWYLLHSYNVINFATILDMSNDLKFFQKQSFGNWICFLNHIIVSKVSYTCGLVTKNDYRSVNKNTSSKLSTHSDNLTFRHRKELTQLRQVRKENKLKHLRDLYSLPNIVRVVKSRKMRCAGQVACMGEGRGVHRVLMGKPEGKRPLRRPRRRWEDNIKMDLQEVGRGCGDWKELAQYRDRWRALVNMVMNLRVSKMRGIS